jgi:hypothetical protein
MHSLNKLLIVNINKREFLLNIYMSDTENSKCIVPCSAGIQDQGGGTLRTKQAVMCQRGRLLEREEVGGYFI